MRAEFALVPGSWYFSGAKELIDREKIFHKIIDFLNKKGLTDLVLWVYTYYRVKD
jgi:hypothetical protein